MGNLKSANGYGNLMINGMVYNKHTPYGVFDVSYSHSSASSDPKTCSFHLFITQQHLLPSNTNNFQSFSFVILRFLYYSTPTNLRTIPPHYINTSYNMCHNFGTLLYPHLPPHYGHWSCYLVLVDAY